jgi:bifunctional pyridoxal-dependent enzyme with beta-cystathionase and maltose regulon repressor activities
VNAHVVPSPSVFGYEATLAALRHGDAWLEAQLEYLRGNRDLVESASELPMAHVEATYLAWIDCASLQAKDPYQHFLDLGVALSPGAQFGAPQFVRLNFGTQRARLAEALRRMRGAAARPAPR